MAPCLAYSSIRSGRIPSDANMITLSVEASDCCPEALPAPSETTSARRRPSIAAIPPSLRLMTISPPLEKLTRGILDGPRTAGSRSGEAPVTVRCLGGCLGRRLQLAAEILDLVPELGRVLEPQLLCGREHLLLERDDELL